MESDGEGPFPPEASSGRAAEGNCVAARRGGEQPEADPRSQTQVNTIRPFKATSLLETGEVRSFWSSLGASHLSLKVQSWALPGGWCENAGKVSCGSNESWRPQESLWTPPAVRAVIVALKAVKAGGAKDGRKANLLEPWKA